MEISVRTTDDKAVTTVGLKGRLDVKTSKSLEDQLLQLVGDGSRRLVMDLSELAYISSAGLRVFILVAKRLKQVDGRVVVCALPRPIQDIFEVAGFSTLFSIYPTRDAAILALR